MNQYNVKLDTFEGPLDLLLHLINQAEVDIYDIQVAKITDQYLEFIQTMKELELDVASEYLVMAATLIQIKSKMLLPKQQEELMEDELFYGTEEDDPRQELMNRLIEYRKYKEAAKELQELENKRSIIHTKAASDLRQYYPKEIPIKDSLKQVSIFDMIQAYQLLVKRKKLEMPLEKTVKAGEYSIDERMIEIMDQLKRVKGKQSFYTLFPRRDRKHIVITFLAVLELMKVQAIYCEQQGNFSDIMITSSKEGEDLCY